MFEESKYVVCAIVIFTSNVLGSAIPRAEKITVQPTDSPLSTVLIKGRTSVLQGIPVRSKSVWGKYVDMTASSVWLCWQLYLNKKVHTTSLISNMPEYPQTLIKGVDYYCLKVSSALSKLTMPCIKINAFVMYFKGLKKSLKHFKHVLQNSSRGLWWYFHFDLVWERHC